jgi:hypothetical protein
VAGDDAEAAGAEAAEHEQHLAPVRTGAALAQPRNTPALSNWFSRIHREYEAGNITLRRGHEHPHGKKKRLRSGHDVGRLTLSAISVPGHIGRMFMAHPHRWALAFQGFRVAAKLLDQRQANRSPGQPEACDDQPRRAKPCFSC